MPRVARDKKRPGRLLRYAVAILGLAIVSSVPAHGQVSPEEHAKHHPGQKQPAGGMSQPGFQGQGGTMGGGMEGMEGMMEKMGAPPPKQQYPSLMELPNLSPEQRAEVEREAHERMRAATAMLSEGLDQLAQAASGDDLAAMQAATAKLREGLAQFESGLAARRALAEGKPPRDVAMDWFKRELSLPQPGNPQPSRGEVLGLSWFHAFVMVVLVGFAVTMIGMYFFKMRRAALLLQDLTGGAALAPPAAAGPAPSPVSLREETPAAIAASPTGSAQPATRKWSGKLRIGHVFQETPDVKTFRLMNPLGGVLPFSYLPGQFLTVGVPTDGQQVRRSYTIASSPTQHDYVELTVKHKEGGEVSGFLHNRARTGDLLESSGPSGAFTFTGRECKCILLIGGGVGITPLMSVLRYLTDRSWPGDIYLLYGCRTPQDIIFREELQYLQRRHANLHVVITVSNPEAADWKGPTGRITKELISQSVPDLASRYVHICGPVPLMESVKKMLAELGVPKERIKTEAFGLALGKPEPARAAPPVGVEEKAGRVALPILSFSQSDKSAPFPPGKTILDVADEIGVEIDNSCRTGVCGTCRVKLLSGSVDMAVEDGLEPGDKENQIVLACQAKSTGNVEVEA